MARPRPVEVVFGVLAAAAVALLSYFVVKRRTAQGEKSSHGSQTKGRIESEKSVSRQQLVSEVAPELEGSHLEEKQHSEGGGDEDRRDILADEGQDQTSFIVLDNGEGAVPPDGDQQPKKSDRSSDESSYDVIDDERLAETVDEGEGGEGSERDEGGHALDSGSELRQPEQDPFLDTTETSMVIIEDSDHSGLSKSSSSFYASADEVVGLESRPKEKNGDEEEKSDIEEISQQTVTDADTESVPGAANASSSQDDSGLEEAVPRDPQVTQHLTSTVTEEPHSDTSHAHASVVLESEIDVEQDVELSAGDITEVLNACQNSPSTVGKEDIGKLVDLLRKKIPELHTTVLNSLLRVAAFTQNIKVLRECGCFPVVARQVQDACKSFMKGDLEGEMLLNSLCQVLTNLTLDPKGQVDLEATIPGLIDLLLLDLASESVKLSVLRPLINFSSQASFHHYYTRAVQDLYNLLDTGTNIVKLQSVKVLVNLSLNVSVVLHMLAAKAPASLIELLDLPTSTDLTLRTVTMLANISAVIHDSNVSQASLPIEDKAASPETMYMALNSVDRLPILRSKVFRLTRHNNEDVSAQASKLYKCIQKSGD